MSVGAFEREDEDTLALFTALALHALLLKGSFRTPQQVAVDAVRHASAALVELRKPPPQDASR